MYYMHTPTTRTNIKIETIIYLVTTLEHVSLVHRGLNVLAYHGVLGACERKEPGLQLLGEGKKSLQKLEGQCLLHKARGNHYCWVNSPCQGQQEEGGLGVG